MLEDNSVYSWVNVNYCLLHIVVYHLRRRWKCRVDARSSPPALDRKNCLSPWDRAVSSERMSKICLLRSSTAGNSLKLHVSSQIPSYVPSGVLCSAWALDKSLCLKAQESLFHVCAVCLLPAAIMMFWKPEIRKIDCNDYRSYCSKK